MIKEIIDLPDTESLKQIVEVLVNGEWVDVKDDDKLSWKELHYNGNKTGIRLSFNDNLVKEIRFICAECGEVKQITVREIKDTFYCPKCATRRYWYFDKAPEDEGEEITDYIVTKVHTIKDNQWHDVTNKDIKVKTFELKKGYLCQHLIYNGLICDEIEFLCKNCNKICHTTWGKVTRKGFSALCQYCATTSEENKKKVAEATTRAMNTPEMYAKMCKIRKGQWKNPAQVRAYMLRMRKYRLGIISNAQRIVTDYVKSVINNYQLSNNMIPFVNSVDEYPLLICDKIKYTLMDIGFPQLKIDIEILGDYWHKAWIDYIQNNTPIEELKTKYNLRKRHMERFSNDYINNNVLNSLNWKILYITETEVNNNNYKAIIDNFIAENELWKYPLSDADKVYLEDDFLEKLLKK